MVNWLTPFPFSFFINDFFRLNMCLILFCSSKLLAGCKVDSAFYLGWLNVYQELLGSIFWMVNMLLTSVFLTKSEKRHVWANFKNKDIIYHHRRWITHRKCFCTLLLQVLFKWVHRKYQNFMIFITQLTFLSFILKTLLLLCILQTHGNACINTYARTLQLRAISALKETTLLHCFHRGRNLIKLLKITDLWSKSIMKMIL